MISAITTDHNLEFEVSDWNQHPTFFQFRVGTCTGLWTSIEFSYVIISVVNSSPGNGHLEDVFQWFENSCKRDRKFLCIKEFVNDSFRKHCLEKRGFQEIPGTNDLIKIF